MSAVGYTPILIYASGTATNVPLAADMTSTATGAELAINYADGKLYYKNSSNVVTLLASTSGASGDVVGPASATDNALARFDLTTGKLIQNSVGILSDAGILTGLTGLTSSGSITFSSLTSGRVTFAGASGLLSDSASLTYDGTSLTTPRLVLGGTTLPSAGTATLFSRTSDNNTYLQTGSGNNVLFLDGSQNTLVSFSPTTLSFNISNTNKLTLTTSSLYTASGVNVGIGTSSPTTTLAVAGGISGTGALNISGSGWGVLPYVANSLVVDSNAGETRLFATGTNSSTQGNYLFYTGTTNGTAAERLRITSAGNVGIGTTIPYGLLNIKGTNGQLILANGNTSTGMKITATDVNYTANGYLAFEGYSFEYGRFDATGNFMVNSSAGTKYVQLQPDGSIRSVHANGVGGDSVFSAITGVSNGYQISVTTGNAQTYKWHNGGTQSMTLDASGNLLVGTTTQRNAAKFTLSYNGSTNNGIAIIETATASGTEFLAFQNASGTNIGSVSRVTTTDAVLYNTTSDKRLKSNIVDANLVLEKLMNVKVRQFDWTEGNSHQDAGFIAQELEPVLSGIVTKGKTEEDMWQIDYARLTPYLVKAIQEQQILIELLTTRLTALENK